MRTQIEIKSEIRHLAADVSDLADKVKSGRISDIGYAQKKMDELDAKMAALNAEYSEGERWEVKRAGYMSALGGTDPAGENPHNARPGLYDNGPGIGMANLPGGLGKAMLDAGFDLKSMPSVEVPAWVALKANVFPAGGLLQQAPPSGPPIPLGYDHRWLWPLLPGVPVGSATTIEDFKQTAKAVTGSVQRAIDAVTDKAVLEMTITHVVETLVQLAVTIDDIPNAVLASIPSLTAFMQTAGQFEVDKAIDAHVMAQIVAAAPPFGTSGANLIERARNAAASMRATGANPTILVVNPTDAAALDLSVDSQGRYIFPVATSGSSSPLWNLHVVERIGAGSEPPYLIDPQMLGVLALGGMRFDADPYTGFKQNLTTLRIETTALFHVRNANGARRIAAT